MTSNDIIIKIVKFHFKKYISYFICSSFAIAIFLMYSIVYFNEKIFKSGQLENDVANAVILPLIILGIFSIIFINYAHSTFIASRSKEFGMFMMLGMSYRDIRKLVIIENLIIAFMSMIVGIITGSIFSKLFTILIIKIMNLKNIPYEISLKGYLLTIVFFSMIFSIVIFITILKTGNMTINGLLKTKRINLNKNSKNRGIYGVVGFIMMIGSLYIFGEIIKSTSKESSDNMNRGFFICIILCIIGLYIFIANFGNLLIQISKTRVKSYYKNMLVYAEINYKFFNSKRIIFISTLLIAIMILYLGFCYFLITQAEISANSKCVYDLSYVQYDNINKNNLNEVKNIIKLDNSNLMEFKKLDFLKDLSDERFGNHCIPYFSESNVNENLNLNIDVKSGYYIKFRYLYDEDEFPKNLKITESQRALSINNVFGNYNFYYQDSLCKKSLNDNSNFIGYSIILDDMDYSTIIRNNKNNLEFGEFHLINFNNWKSSGDVVKKITKQIDDNSRKLNLDENLYKVTSKIELYNSDKESGKLLFFLLSFVGLFFFISVSVMLYFKLMSDREYDREKCKKLLKIGVSKKEMKKFLKKELKPVFFIHPLVALIIAFVFARTINNADLNNDNYNIYIGVVVTSGVYFIFQMLFYYLLSYYYLKKVTK